MAVYRPKRKGEAPKFYVCEFVYPGKRFQESTGATSKTVAKEYEKRRKAETERAAAGLPTDQKATRTRTVADVIKPYLEGYKLNRRPQSVVFAKGRLTVVEKALGNVVLSDLTEDRIRGYIRQRLTESIFGAHDQHAIGRTEQGNRPAVVPAMAEGAETGRAERRRARAVAK